jgi:hypothetical protein
VAGVRSEERIAPLSPRALQAGPAAVFAFARRCGGRRLGALGLPGARAATLSAADLGDVAHTLAYVVTSYVLDAHAVVTCRSARVMVWTSLSVTPLSGSRTGFSCWNASFRPSWWDQ